MKINLLVSSTPSDLKSAMSNISHIMLEKSRAARMVRPNLLTTFEKTKVNIFLEAIKLSGETDNLYIDPLAFNLDNKLLPDRNSLHCRKSKELSHFWTILDKLLKENS